jgi:hypothetical protein
VPPHPHLCPPPPPYPPQASILSSFEVLKTDLRADFIAKLDVSLTQRLALATTLNALQARLWPRSSFTVRVAVRVAQMVVHVAMGSAICGARE